uniref:Coatomer subunit beta n=1 Tax=Lygus hesperus TaxID=30085 RepID=A0A0A9YN75_LYGHE
MCWCLVICTAFINGVADHNLNGYQNSTMDTDTMDPFVDFFTDDPLPNCEDQPAVVEQSDFVNFDTIEQFRQSLLERDPELQLAGLNGLIDLLKSKEEHVSLWKDAFVEANVIETLAQTISSLNTHIVCTSLTLLEELVQSKVFAEQNRASIIVNSVLRCALLFSEVSDDGVVVKMGLDLVSKIIMALVGEGKEFQTFCDLEQLIHVAQTILKSPKEDLSILQSVSQIVYTVLLSSKALLEEESNREVGFPHLVAEVVNQLCRATHSNPDIDIDTAICEVGAACMRLFVRASGTRKDVLEPLHAMIRTAMTKLIVPHINEWVPQTDQNNLGEMITLLKGVISMYHNPDAVEKYKYTKLLVESNFLVILHSLEHICRTWMQYMVVRSLMVEIIVCLCTNELGEFNWSAIVRESMKTLPVQGSLSRLETYSFQDPLSTTIVIYNYFILTTSEWWVF